MEEKYVLQLDIRGLDKLGFVYLNINTDLGCTFIGDYENPNKPHLKTEFTWEEIMVLTETIDLRNVNCQ